MVLIGILEAVDLFYVSVHVVGVVTFRQEKLKHLSIRNVILHDLFQILLQFVELELTCVHIVVVDRHLVHDFL